MHPYLTDGVVLKEHVCLHVHVAAGLLPVEGGEDGQAGVMVWKGVVVVDGVVVGEGVKLLPPECEVCLTAIQPDDLALHHLTTQVHSFLPPKPPITQAQLNKEGYLCQRVDRGQVAVDPLLPAHLLRHVEAEDEVSPDCQVTAGVEELPTKRTNNTPDKQKMY